MIYLFLLIMCHQLSVNSYHIAGIILLYENFLINLKHFIKKKESSVMLIDIPTKSVKEAHSNLHKYISKVEKKWNSMFHLNCRQAALVSASTTGDLSKFVNKWPSYNVKALNRYPQSKLFVRQYHITHKSHLWVLDLLH